MASILPGYEYDIFISYRQKDNKYDGWVTEFVDNLNKELAATFKEDVSIYFDSNPHDGLLEMHNVGKSLEGKLKCLVFIPIISQTYCDPKSFAWQHEFIAFTRILAADKFGKSIELFNGNTSDRILPVRIHDLEPADIRLYEATTGDVLRPVDFIYRLPGVNRQLRAVDDEMIKSPDQILYRDQINKVAHAIKDIVSALKAAESPTAAKNIIEKPKPIVKAKPDRPATIKTTTAQKKGFLNKILWMVPVIALIVLATYMVPNWLNKQRARNELLPAIQKLAEENFRAPTAALDMALEAEKYVPNDSALINLWPIISVAIGIETEPAGAEVVWKDYSSPDAPWRTAGITPISEARFPRGYIRMEIRKQGYQTIEYAGPQAWLRLGSDIAHLQLTKTDSMPEGMVRIPADKPYMLIVGLEQNGDKDVGEFFIDRYEVTNAQYKKFIEAGGYSDPTFWKHPIYVGDKEISLANAISNFVDKTERQGPANWEAGAYPEGKENHPVTGISWYEAAAYAAYAKKELPTVYHWAAVAATSRTEFIVPFSNFNGKGTSEVGTSPGYSTFGIYDLAGNAREWCYNSFRKDQHFILGGGWNDPTYAFNDGYVQSAMDRGIANGFRCIKTLPLDSTLLALKEPLAMAFRDYTKEKPVDDKTYAIYLNQFTYDKTPLNAKTEARADGQSWIVEKISFNAGYNNERMEAYLYLPKNFKPPYQPILYFPGSNDIYSRKYDIESIRSIDFLLKSGRAVIRPIYKGTHERSDELSSDLPDKSVFYKDHVIMWRKDIGRAIDYLETREDIESDKLGYLGWSWGGYMGGIMPAIEPRIKVVVLNVGGMVMNESLPEVDQLNYLPRVKQPVLMLNGKHDSFFPIETSQKPMFNFLGTPDADKKKFVYESGHLVPRTDFVKESLLWYDKYLGPVK